LLGALIVGGPGDRYGSRNMLRVVGMLYVISALGCALAWSFTSFVLCRFLAGIAIGGSSVPAPIFLDKIASAFAFFCEHDGAAIHRGVFLDAGNARRGTGTNERCAPNGGAKSLAPQYVTPRNDEHPCPGD
jgi:MFS family permease